MKKRYFIILLMILFTSCTLESNVDCVRPETLNLNNDEVVIDINEKFYEDYPNTYFSVLSNNSFDLIFCAPESYEDLNFSLLPMFILTKEEYQSYLDDKKTAQLDGMMQYAIASNDEYVLTFSGEVDFASKIELKAEYSDTQKQSTEEFNQIIDILHENYAYKGEQMFQEYFNLK